MVQGMLFFRASFTKKILSDRNASRTLEIRGYVFTIKQILKCAAFLVIAGIHFNCFVYLAHVYLAERRTVCHLSFLMTFSKGFTFSPSLFLSD
jgi:hypothetical protein